MSASQPSISTPPGVIGQKFHTQSGAATPAQQSSTKVNESIGDWMVRKNLCGLNSRPMAPKHSPVVATPAAPGPLPKIMECKQDYKHKDIVIHEDGVWHNVKRIVERYMPNSSHPYHQVEDMENDALKVLKSLTDDEQVEFLTKNFVEILISLSLGQGTSSNNIVRTFNSLPEVFFEHSKTLTVTLSFTNDTIETCHGMRGKPSHPGDYKTNLNFQLLEQVVKQVDKFKSITRMEVVVHSPSNTQGSMTHEHLDCFLPFFELEQEKYWRAQWKAVSSNQAQKINGSAWTYISKQRRRVVGWKEAEENRKRASIDNAVFVRPSLNPVPIDLTQKLKEQ